MENVNVPTPNPFVTQFLRSGAAKVLVTTAGNRLAAIYRFNVHKRSGALAASARVNAVMGGRKKDRWEAHVTVGDPLTAWYAASHEFGTGPTRRGRDEEAYHELWDSLKEMGSS